MGFGLALASWIGPLTGCGYGLQGSHDERLTQLGIRTVYIKPLLNDTYKPGVQNLVLNELTKVISSQKRVRVVSDLENADAILEGRVTAANYGAKSTTTADQLFPTAKESITLPNRPSDRISVATEYSATLNCSFVLKRTRSVQNQPDTLWSGGFSKTKEFAGNNQLGAFGTTSSLINESEFDRALREIARSMMANLHEAMLAQF